MPVTLNNTDEFNPSPSIQNTTSTLRKSVETTTKMVDDALIQLHSLKGVTLKQIYAYMKSTYVLDTLTPIRKNLVKKHLHGLQDSEELKNKTGKGLLGHIKLVDKAKFEKKLKTNEKLQQMARKSKNTINRENVKTSQDKSKTIKKTKTNKEPVVKRKITKPPINAVQPTPPVVPKQTTPVRGNLLNNNLSVSMFDTPVVLSSLHHSTPCVETNIVPQAPERGKITRKRVLHPPNEEVIGTPRSSLPKTKRKRMQ